MAEDYYQILGVSRSADADAIQKAYRKLARKFHPDLHADKEEKDREAAKQKFQKVQQAYDILSDPDKRQMYDQYGHQFEQMAGNPFQGAGAQSGGGGFEEFLKSMGGGPGGGRGGMEDLFRQMGGAFGGGGQGPWAGAQPQPPQRGADLEQEITIPFSVAVLGGKHQVRLSRSDGKIESIDVTIPAGIEANQKIRLRGQGQPSPGHGTAGDLKITVKIAPHPHFTRNGLNLNVNVPVSITEAAEGAKIELPTPHGTVEVSVPPGTSSGKSLRMRGLGIKKADKTGDMIANLQIYVPPEISPDDTEQLKKLSPAWQQTGRDELSW